MLDEKGRRRRWRALVTETLPYEVPLIFSNDRFYAALVSKFTNEKAGQAFDRLVSARSSGTKPYSYSIAKERHTRTTLGVIHPTWQTKIAEFCEFYGQTLLEHCRYEEISLRRPSTILPVFSEHELSGEKTYRLGIPHIDPSKGEMDASHAPSFFSYARFNLLGRFFDSQEFVNLERKYSRLRTLDVSKCFANIYTHSITWAVKDKPFSKSHRLQFSFESEFDQLMQRSNYNETNGIVIGPEISRVFAEIIFQDIDKRVLRRLDDRYKAAQFALRRYVDDYFIFSSSDEILGEVEKCLRSELETYKLYVNEQKVTTQSRPFVSDLTLARRDVTRVLSQIWDIIDELSKVSEGDVMRKHVRRLRELSREIRMIVAERGVGFNSISGWFLSSIRSMLARVVNISNGDGPDDVADLISPVVHALLNTTFYVASLDMRVRTTYALCQIVAIVNDFGRGSSSKPIEGIRHLVVSELCGLIANLVVKIRGELDADNIELYNLLICGAHHLRDDFLSRPEVRDALKVLSDGNITYFSFIILKFCYLKDEVRFQFQLCELNRKVRTFLLDRVCQPLEIAEHYLMLCDYVSSPDVSRIDKREVLKSIVSMNLTNVELDEVCRHVGFADWAGVRIEHLLARKALRPVYAIV